MATPTVSRDQQTIINLSNPNLIGGRTQSNEFQYGNEAGKASKSITDLRNRSNDIINRQAPKLDTAAIDQSRAQQQVAANAMREQIAGRGPSMAGISLAQGLDNAASVANLPGNIRQGIVSTQGLANQGAMAATNAASTERMGAQTNLGELSGAARGQEQQFGAIETNLQKQQQAQNYQTSQKLRDMALQIRQLELSGNTAQAEALKQAYTTELGVAYSNFKNALGNEATALNQGLQGVTTIGSMMAK